MKILAMAIGFIVIAGCAAYGAAKGIAFIFSKSSESKPVESNPTRRVNKPRKR